MQPCLFLLFAAPARPTATQIKSALARSAIGDVAYDPAVPERAVAASDWLELVVDGLTFDVLGLNPGRSLDPPEPRHRFGLPGGFAHDREAIGIAPGPHLAAAANALPVVRTALRLGVALARELGNALAFQWLPSSSLLDRELFVGAVDAWLAGGPFPALGLTGVVKLQNGALASDGLAFFTSQEVELDPGLCDDRVAATRLLARLVDRLVAHEAVIGEQTMALKNGGVLRLVGEGPIVRASPG